MPNEPSAFGALLRRLRLAAKLTQEELAERAGVSPNAIGALEGGGSRAPKRGTLNALAAALHLAGDDAEAFRATAVGSGLSAREATPAGAPTATTPLVGRATEIAAVAGRLRSGVRLLALTGPGGIGKTRVARAAAERLGPAFRDGVRVIEIAAARPPDATVTDAAERVVAAIATALGVREAGTRRLVDTLAEHLRDREVLLVVENLEAAMAAAPLLDGLLAAAPRVAALVTSRESLRLPPAHEYPIGPLPKVDAAALFVARARVVDPDFAPGDADTRAVAEICAHLEGIPLAVELAAARIDIYPPRALRAPLAHRLALLTGGPRTAPTRQWTMRAAIAWSEDLLDANERVLFRRLAVCIGGCTLAAAAAIGDPDGDATGRVADGLTELVAKNLVRRAIVPGEGPRFAMLETIREYALERLAAGGEEAAVRARHADHFLGLAEVAAPHLDGPAAAGWLDRLDREVDNLRAALDWLLARGEADAAVRLAGALGAYWWRRGQAREGRRALERALAPGEGLVPGSRLRALLAAGRLARAQSDPAGARANLDTALALARGLGDERGIAAALDELGIIAALGGAGDAAAGSLFAESLAIARRIDDTGLVALVLMHQGNLARMRGDEAAGSARYAESLALLRIAGNPADYGRALNNVGLSAFRTGDLAGAGATLAESLALLRAAGDTDGLDNTLNSLGQVALARDDLTRAEGYFRESLALAHEIGSTMGIARCLEGFAGLAAAARDPRRAARLFGAAQALLDTAGVRALHVERVNYDRDVGRARAVIGVDAFAEAYAAGRALSPGQVTAETRPAAPDPGPG